MNFYNEGKKMTTIETNLARAWIRALHALACTRNEISTCPGFLHSKIPYRKGSRRWMI
jgi:hypothetical protein